MGTTPKHALPYPELTDTANVPRDLKALADKIDPGLALDVLAAAPGSPVTGQQYFNTADKTLYVYDGAVWRVATAPTLRGQMIGSVVSNFNMNTAQLWVAYAGSLAFGVGSGLTVVSGEIRLDADGPVKVEAQLSLANQVANTLAYADVRLQVMRGGNPIQVARVNPVLPAGSSPTGRATVPIVMGFNGLNGDVVRVAFPSQANTILGSAESNVSVSLFR